MTKHKRALIQNNAHKEDTHIHAHTHVLRDFEKQMRLKDFSENV